LAPFRQSRSSSAAVWKEHLETLWDSLQFPVLSDESDRIAYNHLKSALANLAADLGSWPLDAPTFTAWFRQALAAEIFQVGASEQAGVQVMGLIESRGLAFKRLFLVGMTSTALPQPVRPLPFLDFEERRQIIGATLKSQYNFARAAFHHLMAAAAEIILTKPDEVDGEPVSATPFWPTPWQRATINFWDQPDAAWSRVEWLRSTWRGLSESHLQESAPEPLAVTIRLPRPEERGQRLHKVLACVTRGLRQRQQVNDLDWQRVLPTVQACVDEVHADVAAAPPWQVERRRWLGDELGLLRQWFHQELHHLEAGWRWLAEEIPFKGLSVDGWPTALSGRIDRLDLHPEAGLVCWDYKSGSSPSKSEIFNQLSEPQLPAYLLALLQGMVELPDHQHLQKHPLQAGYITLKSEKDIRLDRLQADADHWQRFLLVWQERLAELGQRLKQGYFDVDPLPGAPERKREQLCTYCGLLTICDRKNFEAR
jgi:RecB family exonuclease